MTSESSDSIPNRQALTQLRKLLIRHFNIAELRIICFDLDVDFEELEGPNKTTKMQDLINYLHRRNELHLLIGEVKDQRPSVKWPNLDEPSIKNSTKSFAKIQTELAHVDEGQAHPNGQQQNATEMAEELQHQRELLDSYRRNLRIVESQISQHGSGEISIRLLREKENLDKQIAIIVNKIKELKALY
ncbi:MAG: hypothetical protein H6657_14705 [Ardenticatenaceae bacterium]|nr:hypothetical protein [Ardenticatenaceae bacterium]